MKSRSQKKKCTCQEATLPWQVHFALNWNSVPFRECPVPYHVGSPNCLENRTFTVVIYLDNAKKPTKERVLLIYRNPLYVAKEYARMIETGEAKNESDLARNLGISRIRVNHFIRLLKLDASIIQSIIKLGDPLPSRIINERMLRPYVRNLKKQESLIQTIATIS